VLDGGIQKRDERRKSEECWMRGGRGGISGPGNIAVGNIAVGNIAV
jgi:hypothetical protein